ncbi:MAG TPA: hypothetical protein VGW74_21045 [Propionibacteriaceae bacterium]|nr:hypothetical protein [Propionibacteriaceae bacterium]
MSTVTDLPEPTEQEVDELAEVLTDAKLRGIEHGHWTLARAILAAGYRRVVDPPEAVDADD